MTESLNLVFCGTPRFAVPTLEKLAAARFRIRLVVTQPDRPKGRGLELVASPVKQCAISLGIPIAQPDRIKANDQFREQLNAIKPDAIVVVGYGRIIPQWMLELPPLGNINLHASLLPRYRGAAPIQWAIANGETTTGVTTMRIDAGLDTGDILLQEKLTVEPDDTAETLSPKLAEIGAALTVKTILGLKGGTIRPQPQDNSRATLAPILKKEDGLIDFSRTSAEILNRLRGFQPWPGAYTRFRGKNLQMLRAQVASDGLRPAEIAATTGKLLVGCGQSTALEILELQLEGKKRIPAHDFIQGYRPKFGETLG